MNLLVYSCVNPQTAIEIMAMTTSNYYVYMFVGSCLATKVFIGKLLATG